MLLNLFIYLGSKAIHDIEPMLLTGDSNHTIASGHKVTQKIEHVQTIESMQVTQITQAMESMQLIEVILPTDAMQVIGAILDIDTT